MRDAIAKSGNCIEEGCDVVLVSTMESAHCSGASREERRTFESACTGRLVRWKKDFASSPARRPSPSWSAS